MDDGIPDWLARLAVYTLFALLMLGAVTVVFGAGVALMFTVHWLVGG